MIAIIDGMVYNCRTNLKWINTIQLPKHDKYWYKDFKLQSNFQSMTNIDTNILSFWDFQSIRIFQDMVLRPSHKLFCVVIIPQYGITFQKVFKGNRWAENPPAFSFKFSFCPFFEFYSGRIIPSRSKGDVDCDCSITIINSPWITIGTWKYIVYSKLFCIKLLGCANLNLKLRRCACCCKCAVF